MKHIPLFSLLLYGLSTDALADMQARNDADYFDIPHYPGPAARDGTDIENTRGAIESGHDPMSKLEPTAAGNSQYQHRYLNGGNFGGQSNGECE